MTERSEPNSTGETETKTTITDGGVATDKIATNGSTTDKADTGKTDAEKADAEKTAEEKAAAEKAEAEKADAEKKAADPANWDLSLPEGVTMSDAQRERVNAYAKEQGLTQAQIEAGAPLFVAAMADMAQQQTDDYGKFLEGYETQAKADPVIGGDNFKQSVGQAEAFVKRYGAMMDEQGQSDGGQAALDVLRSHGMLSHPLTLRLLKSADDATRDDRGVTSGDPASAPGKSLIELMYPNS